MAENVIFVKRYDKNSLELKDINYNEVWRYAGYMGAVKDEIISTELELAINDTIPTLEYKVCYRRLELNWDEEGKPILPFSSESNDLAKCLYGCSEIVMFAATIGMGIDRLVAKNQRTAMTKTLLIQAFGAERVEALCDLFCKDILEEVAKDNHVITPRYSPGYGDLPLEVQRDFFDLLDCNRKIGIALNDSLLMTPSKSVTAIFGIKEDMEMAGKINKCVNCNKTDCEFRQIES